MTTAALSADAEAFLDDLRHRGRADTTIAAYRRDLAGYEAFLAGRLLTAGAAGEGDVASYVAELSAAGRRPSSVRRALVTVRALHRWCGSDTALGVDRPTPAPADPAVLSEAEVGALLSSATGADAVARRDLALLELLYATGARISEVVGLTLADVDDGAVRIAGPAARTVPFGEPAAAALAAWCGAGGRDTMARPPASDDALFVNQRGGRLSRQWGWKVVRIHARRSGLDGRLGPHTLRHSFASHLAARGAPAAAIHQLLVGRPVALGPDELAERYRRWHPRAGAGPPGSVASQ